MAPLPESFEDRLPHLRSPINHATDKSQGQGQKAAGPRYLLGGRRKAITGRAGNLGEQIQRCGGGEDVRPEIRGPQGSHDVGIARSDQQAGRRLDRLQAHDLADIPHVVQNEQATAPLQDFLQALCAELHVRDFLGLAACGFDQSGETVGQDCLVPQCRPEDAVGKSVAYLLVARQGDGQHGLADAGHALDGIHLVLSGNGDRPRASQQSRFDRFQGLRPRQII